jgi:hypothetical protein
MEPSMNHETHVHLNDPLPPIMTDTTPRSSGPDMVALMIERAAANPQVNIDKLERLLDMQERMIARAAKAVFAKALAALQRELPVVAERGLIRDRNGKVQSRYALWEDLNDAIRPALAKHGFSLSFRTGYEGDKILVTGVLLHRAGHSEETTLHLPLDLSGTKNAVQGIGSSTSYGKRYTAQALLNLTSHGEDDDGIDASADRVTEDQVIELRDKLAAAGADETRFTRYLGVATLADLPAAKFDAALTALRVVNQRRHG